MKIVVTGSHFTPAQAVIEQLRKYPHTQIVYLGRSYTREGDQTPSMESQVLSNLGVKFISLTTGRLQSFYCPYHTITAKNSLWFYSGFLCAFKRKTGCGAIFRRLCRSAGGNICLVFIYSNYYP